MYLSTQLLEQQVIVENYDQPVSNSQQTKKTKQNFSNFFAHRKKHLSLHLYGKEIFPILFWFGIKVNGGEAFNQLH